MNTQFYGFDRRHLLGESATGLIAHFSGALSVERGIQATCRLPAQRYCLARQYSRPTGPRGVRLLAECSGASSFPLQGASALASADRYAGAQHAVRNPCFTLDRTPEKCTLNPVQLRFLG